MKKNIFAAIIAAIAFTANVGANTVKNATKATTVETQKSYIYNKVSGESSKVVYSVDAEGRVINKMILHMNNGEWMPVGAYSVHYGETENIVTYAGWNSNTRSFTKNATQQHFDAQQFPVVIAMPAE